MRAVLIAILLASLLSFGPLKEARADGLDGLRDAGIALFVLTFVVPNALSVGMGATNIHHVATGQRSTAIAVTAYIAALVGGGFGGAFLASDDGTDKALGATSLGIAAVGVGLATWQLVAGRTKQPMVSLAPMIGVDGVTGWSVAISLAH